MLCPLALELLQIIGSLARDVENGQILRCFNWNFGGRNQEYAVEKDHEQVSQRYVHAGCKNWKSWSELLDKDRRKVHACKFL